MLNTPKERNLSPAEIEWIRNGGLGQKPVMTRSEFDLLSVSDRMALAKVGLTLVDDPDQAPAELKPGEIRRSVTAIINQ